MKIILVLNIEFAETDDINYAMEDLEKAVRNRVFGEGVFNDDTLVDTWSIKTVAL